MNEFAVFQTFIVCPCDYASGKVFFYSAVVRDWGIRLDIYCFNRKKAVMEFIESHSYDEMSLNEMLGRTKHLRKIKVLYE